MLTQRRSLSLPLRPSGSDHQRISFLFFEKRTHKFLYFFSNFAPTAWFMHFSNDFNVNGNVVSDKDAFFWLVVINGLTRIIEKVFRFLNNVKKTAELVKWVIRYSESPVNSYHLWNCSSEDRQPYFLQRRSVLYLLVNYRNCGWDSIVLAIACLAQNNIIHQ